MRLGQAAWQDVPVRYTVGTSPLKQELQVVWVVVQVAQGEVQATQAWLIGTNPLRQVETQLLP